MKKRAWRWGLAGGAALAILIILTLMHGNNKVTLERYNQIPHRMPADQVTKILGQPTTKRASKGYVKGPDHFVHTSDPNMVGMGPHVDFPLYTWETDEMIIDITFSPDNVAIGRQQYSKPPRTSWHAMMLYHLKQSLRL